MLLRRSSGRVLRKQLQVTPGLGFWPRGRTAVDSDNKKTDDGWCRPRSVLVLLDPKCAGPVIAPVYTAPKERIMRFAAGFLAMWLVGGMASADVVLSNNLSTNDNGQVMARFGCANSGFDV